MAQYGLDASQYPVAGVPVGTILPFVGSITGLPDGWVPCDGRLIQDAGSWFNGHNVPQINGSTYLSGVSDPAVVNTTFGQNDIPAVGAHNHGGQTGFENVAQPDSHGFEKEGDECHIHTHDINQDGGHNHGGENRPLSVGVWFIIRIK
jgi:hypothetical protein